MARFRGTLQGARGEASRLGGTASGLVVVAASWSGAVRVHLYAEGDVDMALVELRTHGGAGTERVIYHGPASGKKLIPAKKRSRK